MTTVTSQDRMRERVAPLIREDPQVTVFADAVAAMRAPIREAIGTDPEREPLAAILDVDTCPEWALPWLAVLAGVRLDLADTPAEWREALRAFAHPLIGTVAAIKAAARLHLEGQRRVSVVERYGGDAAVIFVRTRTDETPDTARTEADVRRAKPWGLHLDYETSDLVSIGELTGTIGALTGDIGDL